LNKVNLAVLKSFAGGLDKTVYRVEDELETKIKLNGRYWEANMLLCADCILTVEILRLTSNVKPARDLRLLTAAGNLLAVERFGLIWLRRCLPLTTNILIRVTLYAFVHRLV
jgi:hypothetical protein